MSDNEVDAELLALADDDSASDLEEHTPTPPLVAKSKSNSPGPPTSTPQQSRSSASKGIARPKQASATRALASKRRQSKDQSEEGEAFSADSPRDSLGSGAMSESESDAADAKADGTLFPVDGMFRSEKEKSQINAMPEIERERLLAERAEEAAKLAQSAKLRQMMQAREKPTPKTSTAQKKRKATSTDLEESPRQSSRAKTKQSENLAAYKRQREQRNQQREQGGARQNRDKKSPSHDVGLSNTEGDAESDVEWDDGISKQPAANHEESPATLEEFNRVRVGRTHFARYCYWPSFEDKIKGCFARVSIGVNKTTGQNTYRMTQIKNFVKGRPYRMEGTNGRPFYTDQYAILAHGKSEKEWPFIACSDSKITDAELSRFLSTLATDVMRTPSRSFLATKCTDINRLLDQRWSEEDISTKIRRMAEVAAAAASYEIERLEKQRKIAVANNNEAETNRLDKEIAIIKGEKPRSPPPRNTTASTVDATNSSAAPPLSQQERLAALNRANRKANTEEIRKAQIEEKKRALEAQKKASARGEAFADPFMRVKTRAKVHHDANGGDSLTIRKKDDLFGEASDRSRAGTPAAGTSRAGTPAPGTAKSSTTTPLIRRTVEKTGTGGVSKTMMDDDILGAMDLGIEIEL